MRRPIPTIWDIDAGWWTGDNDQHKQGVEGNSYYFLSNDIQVELNKIKLFMDFHLKMKIKVGKIGFDVLA